MAQKRFEGKVVVVTGASSGLGRAMALRLAGEGAKLALISRNREALEALSQEIRALGSTALVWPGDVTDAEAMRAAAAATAREFGMIHVWVNNAGISVYGDLDVVPLKDLHRVMDVNFFGQVNGIRAALPYLESSGKGVVVGILSVLAEAAVPLQGVYTASKHALHGMYKTLAIELEHRGSRVGLATLFVPALATPFYDHAKTYLGFRPKPQPPVYDTERYVETVLEAIERPRLGIKTTAMAWGATMLFRFFPKWSLRFQAAQAYRGQRSSVVKGVTEGDNLYRPLPAHAAVRGSVVPTVGRWRAGALFAGLLLPVGWGLRAFARSGTSDAGPTHIARKQGYGVRPAREKASAPKTRGAARPRKRHAAQT